MSVGTITPKRLGKSVLFNLPFIITMASVRIFKGNHDVSESVWASWHPYFLAQYGEILPMGASARALQWDTIHTFIVHLNINFFNPIVCDRPIALFLHNVPNIVPWCITLVAIYYLCVNVNRIKIFKYEDGSTDEQVNALLPQILLVQFVAHLPMFTVLSCDMRRGVFYWLFSSFFILSQFLASQLTLKIPYITTLGDRSSRFFRGRQSTMGTLFFLLVILLIGVPIVSFTINQYIGSTILFNSYFSIRDIFIFLF